MKKFIGVLIFLSVMSVDAAVGSYVSAAWNQYRAVAAYQGNQFSDAQKLLEQAVIDYPHDAQLNYNLGCAYHKQHKEEEALHCFSRSSSSPNLELAEQSYFNMGNSQVALNKIDDAIASYEKVLTLNPHNKAARHNLELIKRKKEQEKKEKKDNKDNKQSKDDQQKNKEQQGTGDQSQNDQQDNKQQQENKKENQQKDNSQQNKSESSDDRTKPDQNNRPNQQEKQKENDKKSKENNNEQVDDKTGEQKSQQEKQSSASQKTESSASSKGSQEPLQHGQLSDTYDKKAGSDKLDKQLQLVLVEAENKDEEQYKKMIKAHVKREMPGQFGQKNW